MAVTDHIPGSAAADLARFEARNSPDGHLMRYAQGRLRTFWVRQTLTFIGAGCIFWLASHDLGVASLGLALLGEVSEVVLLRRVIAGRKSGMPARVARRIAIAAAAVQGLAIAGCVTLCWRMVPLLEARFFAAAFLISAVINAGLGRPFFRAAADVRLALFTLTGFVLMALDLSEALHATSPAYGFFAASFGILSYISLLFIEQVERFHLQRRRSEYALLRHQQDQEAAQARLADSAVINQRLAMVAKFATDSIVISRPDGRIEWVNDGFTRITGYAFADAIGHQIADLLNAEDTDPATMQTLQEARDLVRPVRAEILNRNKSGNLMWIDTSITPIINDAGQHQAWIAVERNVTEAKEREAELGRARLAAEEAGQAKSRFLANMSHEIRTPMNGVIGVAELLAETRLTATQKGYVETILESGTVLLGIINDILDLAKLQSGKATLEHRAFALADCARTVLRILQISASKKGIALRLDNAMADPDRMVMGDEGKLRQILLNLVGNAVKFTGAGAVTVTLRLTQGDGMVEIDVADTGIGIAPDRIGQIFESFRQADDGISRQFGGTGLGLTICAMLAEQMGGGISVRSDIGQGSVFTIRAHLPAADAASTGPTAAPPRVAPQITLRPGLRVMVAEDNRTNMMIVRKMLQGSVTHVIEVENGAQAVAVYQERQPDVILMDVSMPVLDGLQATQLIRQHEAEMLLDHCPIIALTANAFGEDRAAAQAAGLDGFLVKPLSRADLLAAISAYCPADEPERAVIGL